MADTEVTTQDSTATQPARDFIRDIVQADLDTGRVQGPVTRFPQNPTASCTSATPSRSA